MIVISYFQNLGLPSLKQTALQLVQPMGAFAPLNPDAPRYGHSYCTILLKRKIETGPWITRVKSCIFMEGLGL